MHATIASDETETDDHNQKPAPSASCPPGRRGVVEGLRAIQKSGCYKQAKTAGEVKACVSY